MTDVLTSVLLDRMAAERRRAAGLRLGTVTAIDATNLALTVNVAGNPISGVRWITSYGPTVGDFVVVARVDGAWIVLGKLSKDLTASSVGHGTVTASPQQAWAVQQQWGWTGAHGKYDVDLGWTWYPSASYGYPQGRFEDYSPTLGPTVATDSGAVILLPSLSQLLPDGATITAAKLAMKREPVDPILAGSSNPIAPVLYGHAMTTLGAGAPVWSSGRGPWRPGTLDWGQTGQWDLPSAWLTDLLSGAMTGLGIYSNKVADSASFTYPDSFRLNLAYTYPLV